MTEKSTKELMNMSPEEAEAELRRMNNDPATKGAYLDKYGPNGHMHDDIVERVTILIDRIGGGEEGTMHPYLDTVMKYDPLRDEFVEDTAATHAKYEEMVQAKQNAALARSGIAPPPEPADKSDGPLGRFRDKSADDTDKVRSVAELRADEEFMTGYTDPYHKEHETAVQTMRQAYVYENPEPEGTTND